MPAGVLLRSLPNPLTPADLARIRDARPAGPPPQPPAQPLRVERRISSRGSLAIAGQRIQVGMVHAGRTVTVETSDSSGHTHEGPTPLIGCHVDRTTFDYQVRL